jgi:hypothetical protein
MTNHDLSIDVLGGGGGITLPSGKTAIVGFDAAGPYFVTAAL